MATTPISELIKTIQLVKTMQETLVTLADVVERLGERVEHLETRLSQLDPCSKP